MANEFARAARQRHPRSLLMPSATPAGVRAAIARRALDPVYLIVGDDEAEMSRLAADITGLVEDELRAFNVERLYAGEKGVTAAAIVEACRQLPMMGDRRSSSCLRAERLLKPKRRGRGADEIGTDEASEPPSDLDALEEYLETAGAVDHARARRRGRRPLAPGRKDAPQERDGRRVLGPEAGEGHARVDLAAGGPRRRAAGPEGRRRRRAADRSRRPRGWSLNAPGRHRSTARRHRSAAALYGREAEDLRSPTCRRSSARRPRRTTGP